MTIQDAFYVKSLTAYLNDIKPYHSKILDVLVEYQYEDMMNVRAEDYLFNTITQSSNWCQNHFANGLWDLRYRSFSVPATVIPRLLSSSGEATYTAYDALDFTGGQYYNNIPRPIVTLVHPTTGANLLGANDGVLAIVSPIAISGDVAAGGQITGFILYDKTKWNPGTNVAGDNPDNPDLVGFDSSAILTAVCSGLTVTPTVVITHPTGFGCKADCTLSGGTVTAITVRNQSSIVDRDVYRIQGQLDHRRLDKVYVYQAGSGYAVRPPVVRLLDSTKPGNPVIADAKLTAHIRDYVTAITLTNSGAGFTTAPKVKITGTGTGATAEVRMYYTDPVHPTTFQIEAVVVKTPGAGYTTAPTVSIHSYLERVELLTIGKGYADGTLTGITITDPSGALAHPAVINATVLNGSITSFEIVDAGEGFTSDDITQVHVVIPAPHSPALPGDITATARAIIYGVGTTVATAVASTIDVEIINPGSGYTETPLVEVINDVATVSDPSGTGLDLFDTPGGYTADGTGLQLRSAMTGYAPWDVEVKLHNATVQQNRYTIGGPNNSLIQFVDGYAPAITDQQFTIDTATLDRLDVLINDVPVSLITRFNVVLPDADPNTGYGGSISSPSSAETIDNPNTPLNPDETNVFLSNYDDEGYDGAATAAIGQSLYTEYFSGSQLIGRLLAPGATHEDNSVSNDYVFEFSKAWWAVNVVANDKVTICVSQRENYAPEVLTKIVESFSIAESIYLFEHFGVSFSGQYVLGRDPTLANSPDSTGTPTGYAWQVMAENQAPNNPAFWAANQQTQLRKLQSMTKLVLSPNAPTNQLVIDWKNYTAENLVLFDGKYRRTDGLEHAVGTYPNTPTGIHDAEYASFTINLPDYTETINATIAEVRTGNLASGYDNIYGYDQYGAIYDQTSAVPFDISILERQPDAAHAETQAYMTEDISIINKIKMGGSFDTGGSDTGLFDADSIRYEMMVQKTLPLGFTGSVTNYSLIPGPNEQIATTIISDGEIITLGLNVTVALPNGLYQATILGGGGHDAFATVTIIGGTATFNIINGGAGYSSSPTVKIHSITIAPADVVATFSSGNIKSITITNRLTGYTDGVLPATILGDGIGAIAEANVQGGKIVDINIIAGGSSYTVQPTVLIGSDAYYPLTEANGQLYEVTDQPLVITTPVIYNMSNVTVRHNIPFRNNVLPIIVVEAWNSTTNRYVQLVKNVGFTVQLLSSNIYGIANPVFDTFLVTPTIPAPLRISYLWF